MYDLHKKHIVCIKEIKQNIKIKKILKKILAIYKIWFYNSLIPNKGVGAKALTPYFFIFYFIRRG